MIKNINWYRVGRSITVNDKMQKNYTYQLSQPYGDLSDKPEFAPELTPPQMLSMGVFEGRYLNDCIHEFPKEWYHDAIQKDKLSIDGRPDIKKNYFKIKSRLSLDEWRRNHWIYGDDPRGWFQWYCRFYLGRRDEAVDDKQIARWRSFKRHRGAIMKNCNRKDLDCRPKQRQALLQWAYDPTI